MEFKKDPEDRRRWLLVNHGTPGGLHDAIFVGESTAGQEFYEPGELAYVVQYHGPMEVRVILRAGERVWKGSYRNGGTGGTPLVSAGDGTGALVAASRFISPAASCGQALEDADLSGSDTDQIILMRSNIFTGKAVAG